MNTLDVLLACLAGFFVFFVGVTVGLALKNDDAPKCKCARTRVCDAWESPNP